MAKGVKTGGGSRKGAPNKATAEIRAMIEGALSAVGGQKYLEQQAKENPVAFMNLVGKIIPKDVNNHINGNVNLKTFTEIAYKVIEPNGSSRTKDSA